MSYRITLHPTRDGHTVIEFPEVHAEAFFRDLCHSYPGATMEETLLVEGNSCRVIITNEHNLFIEGFIKMWLTGMEIKCDVADGMNLFVWEFAKPE